MPITFPSHTAKFIRALATIGYREIVSGPVCRDIVAPQPPRRYDDDQGDEIDMLDHPDYVAACRKYERDIVLAVCKSMTVRADPDTVSVAGLSVSWGKRMRRIVTWGGKQNLGGLIRDRLDCMLPWAGKKRKKKGVESNEPTDPTEATAPALEESEVAPAPWKTVLATEYLSSLIGVSGIIPGHAAVNAIDMGFSPDGMKISLNPWLEILVLVGVEFAPIAIIPTDRHANGYFAVYSDGLWYPFYRRVRIDPYYYAWDYEDDRGLLPHQFAKLIDPDFSPGPFDDLQIPRHLLDNPDRLWAEVERLNRIALRADRAVPA